jgi:antitoxin component YwqK of YwqJK toxin-antitoxin module
MSTETNQEPLSGQEEIAFDAIVVYKTLKFQQSYLFAIVGGLLGASLGAMLWTVLSIAINTQLGILGLIIGIIVGAFVRYLGGGFSSSFGVIGCTFSIMGYLFGKVIFQIHTISTEESITFLEVIPLLTTELLSHLISNSLRFMDVLYMGVTAIIAFPISRRSVNADMIELAATGERIAAPYARWRIPALILLLVSASSLGYVSLTQTTTNKTTYYDNGARKASGVLIYGKEHGAWSYFFKNGKIQFKGFFIHGEMNGQWEYFLEDGTRTKTETYQKGKLHGLSIEYYPNGNIHTKTSYKNGLRDGNFEMYYDNKQRMQSGILKNGQAVGVWETFYENGHVSSKGNFENDEPSGAWTYWMQTGTKSQESRFDRNGELKLINTWDDKGRPVIVNGKGTFQILSDDNKILESGSIENGGRIGIWEKRFVKGKTLELGEYKDGKYFMRKAWIPTGEPCVVDGEGIYESFYPGSGTPMDSGAISNGRRTGKWVRYFESTKVTRHSTHYDNGVENGKAEYFYPNGKLSSKGVMVNGQRSGEWRWFSNSGADESKVRYVNGVKEGRQEYYDTLTRKIRRWEKYTHGALVASHELSVAED